MKQLKKIMIVDDEPYILHILALKLRNVGYTVLTAADGEEGLELSLSEDPDLIIADFHMPFMDGLRLCCEHRRRGGRAVPAMLITARDFDVDDERAEKNGIAVVLAKPFSPQQVVDIAENLLSEDHYGREMTDEIICKNENPPGGSE